MLVLVNDPVLAASVDVVLHELDVGFPDAGDHGLHAVIGSTVANLAINLALHGHALADALRLLHGATRLLSKVGSGEEAVERHLEAPLGLFGRIEALEQRELMLLGSVVEAEAQLVDLVTEPIVHVLLVDHGRTLSPHPLYMSAPKPSHMQGVDCKNGPGAKTTFVVRTREASPRSRRCSPRPCATRRTACSRRTCPQAAR